MSDRYREVAPATDHLLAPLTVSDSPEYPGAVIVEADDGWAFLSIIYKEKKLGVYLSRDEVTRLYDLLGEAERHLWREEQEEGE